MNQENQHRLALPQGTHIQDFEFHRVLGQGGFGITYLGWNVALDIPVAIKEYLPADLATRERDMSVVPQSSQAIADFQWGLDRFIDEARILARFQHPNIVRVHHFFEAHGTAYIVMDYVEGEDLSAFLTRKWRLKEAELKAILYPILDGLEVVHRADFLHRDIKPGNIVIRDEDNLPVLLDFGAARQAIGAKSRSVTSIITPGYAPIEQYSSRGHQGPWTDIYALGGVCYHALTGQVPDDATDRVRNDPMIPVSERCIGQASQRFLSAIDWAVAVEETDRPQNISAWRAELEGDAVEHVPVSISQQRDRQDEKTIDEGNVGNKSPGGKKIKSKPLIAVICVVALLIVGVGSIIYFDWEKPRQVIIGGIKSIGNIGNIYSNWEKQRREQAEAEARKVEEARLAEVRKAEEKRKAEEQAEKQRQEQAAEKVRLAAEKAKLETEQVRLAKEKARLAAEKAKLETAEKQRQEQVFVTHVGRRPSPDGVSDKGETDLHIAAKLNLPMLTTSLLKQGVDVNVKTNSGSTPLHTAAVQNAHETAVVLLSQGADVNAKDNDGYTPLLFVAAVQNAHETAEVLLKRGADVNAKTNSGLTPLHTAAYQNAHKTAEVLLKRGADANAKDNSGYTSLHLAAFQNAHETAEVLLKRGADANAKDNSGLTPLQLATQQNAHETVEVLQRYDSRE